MRFDFPAFFSTVHHILLVDSSFCSFYFIFFFIFRSFFSFFFSFLFSFLPFIFIFPLFSNRNLQSTVRSLPTVEFDPISCNICKIFIWRQFRPHDIRVYFVISIDATVLKYYLKKFHNVGLACTVIFYNSFSFFKFIVISMAL